MKLLLRIYAFALLVLLVFSFKTGYRENPTPFDYLDIAFSSIALLGLVSYAFSFGFGNPKFWGRYFYVIVAWDLLYNFVITYWLELAQNIAEEPAPLYAFVLTIFILIPEYLALHKYGKQDGLHLH